MIFWLRMDLIIVQGKSVKNTHAFVLLPPDCKNSMELLLKTRQTCQIPHTNEYIFARMYSDTPISGSAELKELANSCPLLKHPERITTRKLRKYIATVSQVENSRYHKLAPDI